MNKHATLLGYAGLIPFFVLPLAMAANHIALFEGALYFNQYSAVILSFLGGVHWSKALYDANRTAQLYIAMLPSIVGWIALAFMPPDITVWVLAAAFIATYLYDLKELDMQDDYRRLRTRLTFFVVLAHAAILMVYYRIGG